MSILERWTKKATKTAHATFKEASVKDVAEKLDILEPIVKILMMAGITIATIHGIKSQVSPPMPTPMPVQETTPQMTVINLIFRKGVES